MQSIELYTDKLVVSSASKIISNSYAQYFMVLLEEHHDSQESAMWTCLKCLKANSGATQGMGWMGQAEAVGAVGSSCDDRNRR